MDDPESADRFPPPDADVQTVADEPDPAFDEIDDDDIETPDDDEPAADVPDDDEPAADEPDD